MQQSNNPNTAQAGLSVCGKKITLCRLPFRGLKHSQAAYTRPRAELLCAEPSLILVAATLKCSSTVHFKAIRIQLTEKLKYEDIPDIRTVILVKFKRHVLASEK